MASSNISGILLQTLQNTSNQSDDQTGKIIEENSAQDLYNCLKTDLWPAICITIDNSAP